MRTTTTNALAIALLVAIAGHARAVDFQPDGWFVEGGAGQHGVANATAGVVWDWQWEKLRRKAFLTAHTEVFASVWSARGFESDRQQFWLVGVLPLLRMQLSQGRSPWHIEIGIGASWMNRHYVTPDRQQGTQWNFYDVLGAGYSFGERRQHEVGFRFVHLSNCNIREPNPGEQFVQLRYATRF
jgi:lipid A 3-O-deacylase